MRLPGVLAPLFGLAIAAVSVAASPVQQQHPLELELSHGGRGGEVAKKSHLSHWAKKTKKAFLDDVREGRAGDWVVVMGNEGGDLDSMTSALTWAYHVAHVRPPTKAVALLQTPKDALDLRPENQLALKNAGMAVGHKDLLTIDELPEPAPELAPKLKGIALVDHNVPLTNWTSGKTLSIIDHHHDRHLAPDASPRVLSPVASCSTLVAREVLRERRAGKPVHGADLPVELVDMLLSVIALDSGGLGKGTEIDKEVARELLGLSTWKGERLFKVMDDLDDEMSKAKKDLGHLTVRDLLRRDYKGDIVDTVSPNTPSLYLGIASVPLSLSQQIERTPNVTLAGWIAIERAWTAEITADVSLALTSFRHPKTGIKTREITLVVRSDGRLNLEQANSLFARLVKGIEDSDELDVNPWEDGSLEGISARRMVWTQHRRDAGRKVVRPVVENIVMGWS